MKIYLAGFTKQLLPKNKWKEIKKFKRLLSYHFITKNMIDPEHQRSEVFLDSGAFSAWSKGGIIDIHQYIQFIKDNSRYLYTYSNLDVIGDPEGTWKNQMIMEKEGVNPLPCFHFGEDYSYLKKYLDKYEYFALGGMVGKPAVVLQKWLDNIFQNYVCDWEGKPQVKIHGFGMTSIRLMERYPWYSVDSTSWLKPGAHGNILVPQYQGGKWRYDKKPFLIEVSNQSPTKKDKNKHFKNMPINVQEIILRYLEENDIKYGRSRFKKVPNHYKPSRNERMIIKQKDPNHKLIEEVLEYGVCNDYHIRHYLNSLYFVKLEESIGPYPKKIKRFQSRKIIGFWS